MIKMEYIRNLNCNYERIQVESDTKGRYQFCLIDRGGIGGLLDCSIRNIDGETYLYYDISSKQTIAQMYQMTTINREWLLDFLTSVKALQGELYRFLLEEENILWNPEQVFQEIDKNRFYFVYIPYAIEKQEMLENCSFLHLCSFFLEHLDYEDTKLVEFVYRMYDQVEKVGMTYLQTAIWKDMEELDELPHLEETSEQVLEALPVQNLEVQTAQVGMEQELKQVEKERKSLKDFFDHKRKKEKEQQERKTYEDLLLGRMENSFVAEMPLVEEEKTTLLNADYIKNSGRHYLLDENGRIIQELSKSSYIIGKAKEKVDVYLEDLSISRMHARILLEGDKVYIEDLNSTNATFLNHKPLQPYEKMSIQEGDQIKCGNVELIYR